MGKRLIFLVSAYTHGKKTNGKVYLLKQSETDGSARVNKRGANKKLLAICELFSAAIARQLAHCFCNLNADYKRKLRKSAAHLICAERLVTICSRIDASRFERAMRGAVAAG